MGGSKNDLVDISQLPPPKPRPRKAKAIDVPPPPYVDDGSHDLLQEVIAIEQAKSAHRHRSGVDKDSAANSRLQSLDDDEEIIALASPAKKDKLSPTSPLTTESVGATSSKLPSELPKSKERSGQASGSRPPSEISRAPSSSKGKEKEVIPPSISNLQKSKNPSPAQATLINDKKCKDVLKALLKLPEAAIFAQPVDPERDGCPT